MSDKKRINSFFELVPKSWSENEKYAAVILEGYSSSIWDDSEARTLALSSSKIADLVSKHPIIFRFMQIKSKNELLSSSFKSLYRNGQRTINFSPKMEELEPGSYVVFLSPVAKVEGGTADGLAREAVGLARGLLFMMEGHTVADQRMFGMTLQLGTVQQAAINSPTFENFLLPEEFSYSTSETVKLVSERLRHNNSREFKNRLAIALTFLGRAASEMDATVRFTNMWIALEVVAGGYGQIEKLITDITSDEGARQKLREIKGARDRLFHHGGRYALSQAQEQLICIAIAAELFRIHNVTDPKLQTHLKRLANLEIAGIQI